MIVQLAELIAEHGTPQKYRTNYLCDVKELIFEIDEKTVIVRYVYMTDEGIIKKEEDAVLTYELHSSEDAESYASALTSFFADALNTQIIRTQEECL